MTWEKLIFNEILQGDGFYISYNPGPFAGTTWGSDDGGAETAFCFEKEEGVSYLILNGDFRKEYEDAFPDPEKCLEVYLRHRDSHKSSWSSDMDDGQDIIAWIKARLQNLNA